MTGTGRFHEVRAVIDALGGVAPEDRADLLESMCAGDPQLRDEVEAVLGAMNNDDAFLEPPLPGAASKAYTTLTTPDALSEDMFPGYRVLRVLGEGGMGVIYEAEQDRPKRRVALKVMRSALPTEDLRRRFALESEILGRLQHPGVARIYEVGTYGEGREERPFFAMEFVEGETLTKHAGRSGLDTRQRAEMLVRICEAVEHAHQKGVIHRDLKPSNILVDREGVPKILDFGVARSIDADLQITAAGTTRGQIIGTLAYMSPEQLSGDPDGIDTRADVYALGVIAYELFAGRTPHDVTNRSFPEAIRTVQDDEPPTLGAVQREMRGDLSTIVLKAMEKDRSRRYQSASLLASDLTRFLKSEPILARPPTTVYRVQKFTSRNPMLVGGLAAVFFVLVAGIIATSSAAAWAFQAEADARANAETARLNAEEAERNAAEAARESAIADAVNDFLNTDLLAAANPQNTADRDITMREVLDIAATNIEGRFESQPLVEARVRLTLSQTYQNLAELEAAERHGRIGLERLRANTVPGDPDIVSYSNSLATTLMLQGRFDEARTLLEPLAAERKAVAGPLDELYLLTSTNLGSAYMQLGRLGDAEPLLLDALDGKKKTLGEDHPRTLTSVHQLGNLYWTLGRNEDAVVFFEDAYEGRREALGTKHPSTLTSMVAYATLLSRSEATDDARRLLAEGRAIAEEILGPEHQQTLNLINAQAMNEIMGEDYEAALAFAREATDGAVTAFRPDHPLILSFKLNVAKALAALERHSEALPILAFIEEREAETLPENHWYRASTLLAHAKSLRGVGRLEEAEDRARSAYCIYIHNYEPDNPRCIDAVVTILDICERRGAGDAVETIRQARDDGTLASILCADR